MDPSSTPITQVMTREIVSVAASTSLDELAALLDGGHIGGVPVLDPEGRPVGVVSRTDLVAVREASERPSEVRDLMMSIAFSVPESGTLADAVRLMASESIHRVLVLGADRTVVGIVSAMDVVRWLATARDG